MDFDEVVDDDFTESKVATDEFDVPEAEPQRYLPVNQYQVRPSLDQTFQITKVRQILQDVLSETLSGKTYSAAKAAEWTRNIADDINLKIKDLDMHRYKHIVQVTVGQQNGAGCRSTARCRWDAECDSMVSESFTNETLFCIVAVFGIYFY